MKDAKGNEEQIHNLLYEALETELGGIQVYQNAIQCAQNEELKEEWEEYLEQTENHEQILRRVLDELGLDAETETPGRAVVRHQGESLVEAIQMARSAGDPDAAQIVAAECVVLAETKDHSNWELLGELGKKLSGEYKKTLTEAYEEVEEEEDEHLYHTMGWARELWMQALGLPAVLPPPEETKDVKTAIGAERAKNSRSRMIKGGRSRQKQPSP
jgi:rubrerythrin